MRKKEILCQRQSQAVSRQRSLSCKLLFVVFVKRTLMHVMKLSFSRFHPIVPPLVWVLGLAQASVR